MTGFVDLHSHYLPGIDDGVRTYEDGLALVKGLAEIGFAKVVATPHIRTAMFPNERDDLRERFAAFCERAAAEEAALPELGLGAEHFFDDVVWGLFQNDRAQPYPGGHAALIELNRDSLPKGLDRCFFQLKLKGVHPVLAHPERYAPFAKKTAPMDPLLDVGALPLLDLMSLTGKYGRRAKRAAERMLDEGVYYAACSDAHRPADVPVVASAIARLRKIVGDDETHELLVDNPKSILDGSAEY